jgi:mRNA-degrading endonuclease RelE of RelBE toxin-antitoxin system
MNYRVVWSPGAELELADVWLAATDRNQISRIAREIDVRLQQNPNEEGESRTPGVRILIEAPLGVSFQVEESRRRVLVVHVWRFRTT